MSRNPDMKIIGRAANLWGMREKREQNERMISTFLSFFFIP
jgi:hypothetical protein